MLKNRRAYELDLRHNAKCKPITTLIGGELIWVRTLRYLGVYTSVPITYFVVRYVILRSLSIVRLTAFMVKLVE